MGRKSGWLSYGVAIAGEAHMVVGVEDIVDNLLMEEDVLNEQGAIESQTFLSLDALVDRVVRLMIQRQNQGKGYGVDSIHRYGQSIYTIILIHIFTMKFWA